MKQKLLKTLVLLCALIVGSATSWAEDEVYKTALFGASYNANNQNYTSSFDATNSGFVVTATNFNNNNNGWTSGGLGQIKCGRDGKASVATIITKSAIDRAITKVLVKIDAITTAKVNSIKLYTSSNGKTWTEAGTFTKAKGNQSVALSSPAANLYYKVEFNCASGKSNGLVTISKVEYYKEKATGTVDVTGVSLDETLQLEYGQSETLTPTFTPAEATNQNVTWKSSNTSVATVDASGKVTTVAVGTATITVTTEYGDFTDDCKVTVTAPEGKETAAPAAEEIFSESWTNTTGEGGNDGKWSGSLTFKTIVSDKTGWSYTECSGADNCVKIGAGSSKGSVTTPAFGVSGNLKVTFRAAAWNTSDEGTVIILSVIGTGTIDKTSVELTKAEFTDYEVTINGALTTTKLNFEAKNKNNNRFFLDDVKVFYTQDHPSANVTLNKYGYATYCSVNPIDFTNTTGYTAWRVREITKEGTITFNKITEKIKGGQGVVLYNKDANGVNTSNVTVTFADGTTEFDSNENKLVGTLAPTYVEAGTAYGLSGNKFVVNNGSGNISAGKAYIEASSIPTGTGVKDFTLVFEDETTGITETRTATREEVEAIFNLAGQRMSRMHKGVNIVNGKKILVK